MKDGIVYMFLQDHPAGAWTGEDAQATNITTEIELMPDRIVSYVGTKGYGRTFISIEDPADDPANGVHAGDYWIQQNPDILKTLMSYTDATSRLGDLSLSQTAVSSLSTGGITEVLNRVSLPAPLNSLLQTNLEQQTFSSAGLTQVGDYVSQTIAGAILHVLCYVVCFLVLMFVFHFVLNFLKVLFKFPVLKQANALAGGAFGLLRGALLCFVAFALLPLVQTTVPIDGIQELIEQSTLAPLFNNGNLILAIMRGGL